MTLESRKQKLASSFRVAKANGSTYKLRPVDDRTLKVEGTCRECGAVRIYNCHAFEKRGCWCQRTRKTMEIQHESHHARRLRYLADLATRDIRILTAFRTLHNIVTAECLSCNTQWQVTGGNLRSGHGCPKCAIVNRRKLTAVDYAARLTRLKHTFMERYGVEHALQHKAFFYKAQSSGYRLYDYKLGRKTIQVQGYEPFALDYILSRGVPARCIVAGRGSDIPSVPYRLDGKRRVYHPDIWLPDRNLIVEVKSYGTYMKSLRVNLAKRRAAEKAGFRFMFLVMNRDGTRRDVRNDTAKERTINPNCETRTQDTRRKSAGF